MISNIPLNKKFAISKLASQFAARYRLVRKVPVSYDTKFQIVTKKKITFIVTDNAICVISIRFVLFDHRFIRTAACSRIMYCKIYVTATISRYSH